MTELLTDSRHTRSDLRMIETAIRKGWKIPDELLETLPTTAAEIATRGKPRDQIAAMSLLVKMKEQNDKAEPQPTQKVEHSHKHLHELGPVTADNLLEHKRRLLEEFGS